MYYPTRQIVMSVFVCCFIFTWFSFRNQWFGMFRDPNFALFPSDVVSWISCIPVFLNSFINIYTIIKLMRALWLVNQVCFIVPVNPWKFRASSELLYKSNRPQVFMVHRPINYLWRTLEEFVNHSPAARDLQILLVLFQHPAWFISL